MSREGDEGGPGPSSDFPDGLVANVSDAGGVMSASVEETNRVRAALGLKPLADGSARAEAGRREAAAGAAARAEATRADAAAELAARVAEARERRELADSLRAQKTLADDDAAGDDAAAWIERSRRIAAEKAEAERRAAAKAAAARRAAALDEQDEGGSDDDDGGRPLYTARDLAGLKVVAGADDLAEGETMVLTLKDSRIIGADGDVDGEDDTLENVRLSELRSRERARAAAKRGPAGPGAALAAAEEEGPRRLLAKYDEAEGPEAMALDADGAVDAAKRAREAEVRRRLAAAAAGVVGGAAAESAATAAGTQADFFSPAEMAAFAAPKKLRKKKKLRPRPLTADELVPLEEDEETAKAGGADHGSRARAGQPGAGAAAAAADAGWARFDAAKAKAAEATARLIGTRGAPAGEAGDDVADADEDAALAAALERSRRAAAAAAAGSAASSKSIAARIAAERAAAGAGGGAATTGASGGVMFTDTQEFVRTISVERARAKAEAAEQSGIVGATVLPPAPDAGDGDEEEEEAAAAAPKARRPYRDRREADEAEAAAAADEGRETAGGGGVFPPPPPRAPAGRGGVAELASAAQSTGAAARGLAATMALLKDKGALTENVTWAGRTTDKKKDRIAVALEADAIGTSDPRYNFDFKLDRFDEFGRKMTPKEAFRELCHKFHGIFPSRNKQEARLRQWHEEQARLKAASGDTALESAEKLRAAQLRTATPFVVLSGSIKSAQVTDASSRYATAERAEAAMAAPARPAEAEDAGGYGAVRSAAALGGGAPLEGAEKVRFMLGIPNAAGAKRGAAGAAGAHAAKRPRPAAADE